MSTHPTTPVRRPPHPDLGQRERVCLLRRRLLTCEAGRRRAARAGNTRLASDLANLNRELISDARPGDLRSLVTIWLLDLGKATEGHDADATP